MSNVADKSPQVTAMGEVWAMLAALVGGTSAMRRAPDLMPRFPNEDAKSHDTRIKLATLFPAYERTVSVMASKPFSKPVTFGADVPDQIVEWCENFDLEGVNLHAFAQEMFAEAFFGLAGIVVDVPRVEGEQPKNKAQQDAAGIRPYGVRVKHNQIRGWRTEIVGGRSVLTMLRYCEEVQVPDGDFGTKTIEQIRVLTPGRWEVYRKKEGTTDGKEEWVLHDEGTTSLACVPFVPVYGKRLGFMRGKPPLENLAYLNVKHWQSQSDQDTILHVARVPILAVIGASSGQVDANGKPVPFELTVGASAAVQLPLNADMKYVEHTGQAIAAGQASLDALEKQMIQAGAELLVRTPGARTATEASQDGEANRCDLQRMAETFEDSLDQVLQIMADYAKLGSGGHVELYDDYGAATLDAASGQLILALRDSGLISDVTAIEELKRRNELSSDVDAEEEASRVKEQGPSLGEMTPPALPMQDPAQAA